MKQFFLSLLEAIQSAREAKANQAIRGS